MNNICYFIILIFMFPCPTNAQPEQTHGIIDPRILNEQETDFSVLYWNFIHRSVGYEYDSSTFLNGNSQPPEFVMNSTKKNSDHPRLKNTMIGMGIGAGVGLATALIASGIYDGSEQADYRGIAILVYTPLGAGIGALVGALVDTD